MGQGFSYGASTHHTKRSTGGGLSQSKTNGKSILGTLLAPTLPYFLSNNPTPNGYPWSHLHHKTNYYKENPRTGVIRNYDFTISRAVVAPDGYERPVLLVNEAFPGPTIEANWGDTIQVTVHNHITGPEEGMAMHWHGFLQTGRPWEDGVGAVTQCPIAPGKSLTYQFQAELYGTTWYHSHYSAQYNGGLLGPIVIYGPRDTKDYDVDIGPVILTDWYHKGYLDLVKEAVAPDSPGLVYSINNLINGKGNFNCSDIEEDDDAPCTENVGLSKFRFQKGKTHRIRLMNAGSEGLQRFSIDGHTMQVIANDWVQIEPYDTEVVTLAVGQRTDVLVKADGYRDAYWMRSNLSTNCSLSKQPFALAQIYYDDADTDKDPESTAWDAPDPATCANDDLDLTKPLMRLGLPDPDKTIDLEAILYTNATNYTLWSFGNRTFRGDYNSPTLLLSNLGNRSFEDEWNVRNVGDAKSVRVVINNNNPAPHPMHLHGFNLYVLHEGPGAWDGTIINPDNPQRRDVVEVRQFGHLVVQFDAGDNPGVWPFHCHIAWHVSGGFFTQFLVQPDKVEKMHIPQVIAETCREWGAWTNTNIPDQIDSGL